MQNKGAIKLLTLLMALVCVYQLLFTWATWKVERQAKAFSGGDYNKEASYIDSMSNQVVYNFLGLRKYTYNECKERQIVLGLDLKGGMNVTLEVQVADIIRALSGYSTDETFVRALAQASEMQKNSREDFIDLFGAAFHDIDPNARLASIFNTVDLRERINFNSTDAQVLDVIREEADAAIENAFIVIRSRIDRFGVTAANIQRLETRGRILVELPGVTERDRVRKLLQGTANLEFWETYENSEIYPVLVQANLRIKDYLQAQSSLQAASQEQSPSQPETMEEAVSDSVKAVALLDSISNVPGDSLLSDDVFAREYPLFNILHPSVTGDNQIMPGSVVGMAQAADTAEVMQYFALPQVRSLLPRDLKLLWSVKPFEGDPSRAYYELHAIKQTGRDGRPPLDGRVVTSARGDYQQNAGSQAEVSMSMNAEGAKIWARMTRDYVGRCIAIVRDNNVYSAPWVNSEISGGNSQITGNFTINEATDLANILKSGKMPAPARIVQDEVVGPSLGQESVSAGLTSFLLALLTVLLYLAFYYSSAGIVADIALIVNMLFLMGVMASVGVVLTLPGIAGIVLSLGMADDANVIIFERVREELRLGKSIRNAIADGYKNAYSAIIDGQMTTLITGIILFLFGSGPIQGFATTLVLGIFTSLFCSIFITRLIYEWMMDKNMSIRFSIPSTENIFVKAKYNFIGVRKKFYAFSLIVIGAGILSIFVQGFNYGIDFTGGRNFVVNFGKAVTTNEIREVLSDRFPESSVEVKTFGSDQQVKITTDYLIDQSSEETDNQVEMLVYEGVKPYLANPEISFEQFRDQNILSSQKVGPTIADDIKVGAVIAVIVALLFIFLYIFVRFRNWRFGLGALISLFHDATILIVLYSLLWKIMPFSLEIDQHFIAAILAVIGYSINDTVIIYDRIREFKSLYPKRPDQEVFNAAINSTLGRTMNTSLTTILVMLVIFIWGGEVIRGFSFAMMIGIMIGTYSSVFNAAPIVFDLLQRGKKK